MYNNKELKINEVACCKMTQRNNAFCRYFQIRPRGRRRKTQEAYMKVDLIATFNLVFNERYSVRRGYRHKGDTT